MAEQKTKLLAECQTLLSHLRYLAGCQCGEGDFGDENPPSQKEWSDVVDRCETVLDELSELTRPPHRRDT